MWLVRNGISPELAFAVDDVRRTAWAIIFSQMSLDESEQKMEFDWDKMDFVKVG